MSVFSSPTLLYDGNCRFCLRSVQRLRPLLHPIVTLTNFHDALISHPELQSANFDKGIKLVIPSGQYYTGAEAILLALYLAQRFRWVYWLYKNLSIFRWAANFIYARIAANRHRL